MLIHRRRQIGGHIVTEFAHAAEGHRHELLLHCYRMLGSLPDAEDAVQETMLRAWRYRESLKEGAPLRASPRTTAWMQLPATRGARHSPPRSRLMTVLQGSLMMLSGLGRSRTHSSSLPRRRPALQKPIGR